MKHLFLEKLVSKGFLPEDALHTLKEAAVKLDHKHMETLHHFEKNSEIVIQQIVNNIDNKPDSQRFHLIFF